MQLNTETNRGRQHERDRPLNTQASRQKEGDEDGDRQNGTERPTGPTADEASVWNILVVFALKTVPCVQ